MRKPAVALLLLALPCGGCVVTDQGPECIVPASEWCREPVLYAVVSVPTLAVSGLVVAARRAARARGGRHGAPVTTRYRDPGAPSSEEIAENWRKAKRRRR